MALFLVDRQMYQEASEVFYSHAFLHFYGDDFSKALAVLRQFPLDSIKRLRRLQFTMTVAQCDGWGAGALASGYPEHSYKGISKYHWDGSQRPQHDYQADWQTIVDFLANNADLPRLRITVDMSDCGCAFEDIGEMLTWPHFDFAWFRFVYDFYIGISTSLCSLKELGAVDLDLWPFQKLKPWLEREIMGCRNGYGSLDQPARQGYGSHIPAWHDMNKRLEGSNYPPPS